MLEYVMILLAWVASIIGLIVCFFAGLGWGLAATRHPHASVGYLLLLSFGPTFSLTLAIGLNISSKLSLIQFVLTFLPGLLSVLELVFVMVLWHAG